MLQQFTGFFKGGTDPYCYHSISTTGEDPESAHDRVITDQNPTWISHEKTLDGWQFAYNWHIPTESIGDNSEEWDIVDDQGDDV